MIIGVTGHRTLSHSYENIYKKTKELFIENEVTKVVSGMALGFDTIAAKIAIEMNIPLIAALPFEEQAKLWNEEDKETYISLLEKAEHVYVQPIPLNSPNRHNQGYFGRNRWIVSQSNILVAYMINDKDGGTAHTWKEAGKKDIPRFNVVNYL